MDSLVEKIEQLPLSGDDLLSIAECLGVKKDTIKWMLYDNLENIKDVDELFGDKLIAIYILLQIKNPEKQTSVGHWVLFINHKEKGEYYWHDPYGLRITQDLSLTHEPDFIIKLTKGLVVQENIHRHQKFRDDINTCGRHTVVRSVFYHLNPEEYNNLVIKPMVPHPIKESDDLVALITGLASSSDRPLIEFFNKKES